MARAESIEALLSPSLRVSRPVAACSRCRGAKIKCDGKLPACTACERSGKASSCSGANDEFAKGKERSYVAALEGAAERLQKRINAARASQSPGISRHFAGVPFVGTTLGQSVSSQKAPGTSRASRKEASDVDDLVGDFGFLSVNATSRDFHGFTSTMSFARLLLSVSMVMDLPTFDANPLPPRHVATSLIEHYLDNIFVIMPFFSETDLMASVSAVYSEGRHARQSDHWFVRMILAISAGAISQNKDDVDHQTALRHVTAAMTHVEAVVHPGAISGVQAILLLVLYSLIEPEYFRSWDLIGLASRVMVDLGLHVEPSPEMRMAKGALDMRRKVFYCVYTLDRYISIAYGRAFSFTDDSASVLLPVLANPMSPNRSNDAAPQLFLRSLQPSLYLFDIRRVQSAFYQTTHFSSQTEWPTSTASEYNSSILQDIRAWYATIPASLSQRHILFFRLESLYSQILALSPSCRIPSSNMSDLTKTLIFEYTIQFTDQLLPAVQDTNWHAFLTYVDFLRVNTIGRQFREAMWSNFDQLLSGGVPHSRESSVEPGSALPPTPLQRSTSPLENCARAIQCLNNIIEILDYARQRWSFGNLCEKFQQESAVLMGKLRNKQQELGTPQYFTGDMSHLQGAPMQDANAKGFSERLNQPRSVQAPRQTPDQRATLHQMTPEQEAFYPQIARSLSHEPFERPTMYGLPSGSLPRRSYEFVGGQGAPRRNEDGTLQ